MARVDGGIPPNETTYIKVGSVWPRAPRIAVVIQGASEPVRLPLEFVRAGGDDTWGLVHRMISALVNEPGQLQDAAGELLALDLQPMAGEYRFMPLTDDATFSWRQGPTGFRKGQAIKESESEERSRISACSTDQSPFCEDVIGRDTLCLITHAKGTVQAAHIIPKGRDDIYKRLLEDDEAHPFETRMGLLLRNDLHKAYDQQWSLYCTSGSYFVHVFKPEAHLMQYHGLEIPPGRFAHVLPTSDHPDPRLCNWHYEQCLLMRLRGFSSGMAFNAM